MGWWISSRLTGELGGGLSSFSFRFFFHFLLLGRDLSLCCWEGARNGRICILWKSGWSSFLMSRERENHEFFKSYHRNLCRRNQSGSVMFKFGCWPIICFALTLDSHHIAARRTLSAIRAWRVIARALRDYNMRLFHSVGPCWLTTWDVLHWLPFARIWGTEQISHTHHFVIIMKENSAYACYI